jgi:phenylpropionate dioxygenase-like ring-hydroxylating dioxygenase large terminal subunit
MRKGADLVADHVGPKQPTLPRWLAADERKADAAYAKRADRDMGTDDIPVDRYISRAFHDLEMKHMWSRAWQMACHETDIPDRGNYITYEIGSQSWILVRQKDGGVRAFANACLHRGMQLVDGQGSAPVLTCPFHGWSWNIDGTNRAVTQRWDFPQLEGRNLCLPEAKIGRWGGFVFINPDQEAESFADHIGELPDHFRSAPLEHRRVAVHVARVMPANWKVAMEAFLESYHVSPTHPQSVAVSEYAETQYDIYGDNLSRLATISIAPVSDAMKALSDQEFADLGAKTTGREPIVLAPGETYRQALANERRTQIGAVLGQSIDHLSDCEMLDAVEYFLFPNFLPWHGYGLPIVYRFRPNGDRHDSSIMEIYLLAPRNLSEPPPKAAEIVWLPEDRPFADYEPLGRLGPIFDQDYVNIAGMWKGLHATRQPGLWAAHYQESRIRHYHRRIDDFIALDGTAV